MARPTSSSEAERLVALIEEDGLEPGARRRLLTALARAYARDGRNEAAVEADGLTADEAAGLAAALMRAKDVTSFELAALFNV